ncbi:cell envelope integrity protein CreD [Epibacterium sp. SM1969]|uniref:Cell envelope integrity protein CreD n=1 Tax=Tritonibacter aquimaris TaxID=2663379 RepID=A0A844AP18_9RHOB|nr:cell envelope integrity protein CreD [Tritonibacter aquimaris]MQY42323.1 cell envelope integrity protein CreD [Tritonibacter aquimaris]
MLRSMGRRFFIVGLLVLLMFVPLFFAAEIVQGRKGFSASTIENVGREWGGAQILSGPQLVIPVERTVTRIGTRPQIDPDSGAVSVDAQGDMITVPFSEQVTEAAQAVFLYPEEFSADLTTTAQIRERGIFEVPVYQADADFRFDFNATAAATTLAEHETILWDKAYLRLFVSSNRALRGAAVLKNGDAAFTLEPFDRGNGIQALVGDPRDLGVFTLELEFNGAQYLRLAPVGRDSQISVKSDWPHPSFDGAFLPDEREISEAGFAASWRIPHLARALPQVAREDLDHAARNRFAFGVTYLRPNDFYQKAYRAARYGILFIALTFLTILLVEKGRDRPVHPVQYLLVGLAQSLFVLLMVAYAELIGFAAAYLLAAGATVALLTFYGWIGMHLGRRAFVLGAVLVVVYAVLYLILRSADYALLAGSTLAFMALALTMVATRNEDWFGPQEPKKDKSGFWGRSKPAETAAPDES